MRYIAVVSAALAAAFVLACPAVVNAKTVKECREEWQAHKAENQAKKITEKAYVAQCESGAATVAPAPAAAPVPAARTHAKTARECREEWQAHKAENQAKKITEKAYVAQCEAGTTTMAPPAPAPQPANSEPKTAPAPQPRSTETKTAPAPSAPPASTRAAPAAPTPTGANQYSSEAQAKTRCGTGTVVWVNLNSKIYHFQGHKDYGHTKHGAYMCEADATSQGMRAAKDEKHP